MAPGAATGAAVSAAPTWAQLLGYRELAEAVLVMAVRDWVGVGELKARNSDLARLRARLRADARAFWRSAWCRELCEYVGWRHELIRDALSEAERDPAWAEQIARRLQRGIIGRGW